MPPDQRRSTVDILLVEDDEEDRLLTSEMLAGQSRMQFTLEHAPDLATAGRLLAARHFDVVLLDLRLPDGTGLECIATVRLASPGVAIVVLTGFSDEEMAIAALEAGAQDYLLKGQGDPYLMERAIRYAVTRGAADLIRRQLAAIVSSSEDAIIGLDRQGLIRSWNPGAERLYGYTEKEALGRDPAFVVEPAVARDHAQILASVLDGQRVAPYEARHQRKDGSRIDVSLTVSPVSDGNGPVMGAAMIARDITERKRGEDELRAAREQALAASESKSRFVADISHEIRTPLNSVIGYTDLLLRTDLDDDQREFAETIRTAGDALLAVINDTLDLSKIEAGRFELNPSDFSPHELVKQTTAVLAGAAREKSIELKANIGPEVPTTVRADSKRIGQVLTNLVANAVNYTDRGHVLINLSWHNKPETARLRFEVVDTGLGIPAEAQAQLFTPFVQWDRASRDRGGTGLGLAISKQLVTLMDGDIGVRSPQGDGTTFWFDIPVNQTPSPVRTR